MFEPHKLVIENPEVSNCPPPTSLSSMPTARQCRELPEGEVWRLSLMAEAEDKYSKTGHVSPVPGRCLAYFLGVGSTYSKLTGSTHG